MFQFGKGIYFADMSSKSANYCFASRLKNTGLLLLSEVGRELPMTASSLREFDFGFKSYTQNGIKVRNKIEMGMFWSALEWPTLNRV